VIFLVVLHLFNLISYEEEKLPQLYNEIQRISTIYKQHKRDEAISDVKLLDDLNVIFFNYFTKKPIKIKTVDERFQLKTKTVYTITENKCLIFLRYNVLAVAYRDIGYMAKLSKLLSTLHIKLDRLRFSSDVLYRIVNKIGGELISAKFVMPTSIGVIEIRGSKLSQTKTFMRWLKEGKLIRIGFIPKNELKPIRIVYISEQGSVSITGDFDFRHSIKLLDKILSLSFG